ncbi:hypothetical protein S40293_11256 [Stachybotrys chartarum IBT 40293]|nr:hypothetical protein S40293_11256 [Stachybotrys chartarum IBT 40293]
MGLSPASIEAPLAPCKGLRPFDKSVVHMYSVNPMTWGESLVRLVDWMGVKPLHLGIPVRRIRGWAAHEVQFPVEEFTGRPEYQAVHARARSSGPQRGDAMLDLLGKAASNSLFSSVDVEAFTWLKNRIQTDMSV